VYVEYPVCEIDKSFLLLYVWHMEDQFEALLEKALPEHIVLFRRLIIGLGLSWEEACQRLKDNG
jgi:hypothetical protein